MDNACECCGYELDDDDSAGTHCPKCGEDFWVLECEDCGYHPDEDALIHGLNNGYCPKCGGEWDEDGDDCDHEFDYDGDCDLCGVNAEDVL